MNDDTKPTAGKQPDGRLTDEFNRVAAPTPKNRDSPRPTLKPQQKRGPDPPGLGGSAPSPPRERSADENASATQAKKDEFTKKMRLTQEFNKVARNHGHGCGR